MPISDDGIASKLAELRRQLVGSWVKRYIVVNGEESQLPRPAIEIYERSKCWLLYDGDQIPRPKKR